MKPGGDEVATEVKKNRQLAQRLKKRLPNKKGEFQKDKE